MSFKRAKVVMLPTNNEATLKGNELWININGKLKLSKPNSICPGPQVFQHLYITSDEEIKVGKYGYDYNINEIFKCEINQHGIINHKHSNYYKIIATTDTSLYTNEEITGKDISYGIAKYIKDKDAYYKILPQPSQQFIEKYIEEYNKGQQITKCLVEYEEIYPKHFTYNPTENIITRLKVDKDNTITIKKVKDSWNREEVVKLCKQAFLLYKADNSGYPGLIKSTQEKENKWIEENL